MVILGWQSVVTTFTFSKGSRVGVGVGSGLEDSTKNWGSGGHGVFCPKNLVLFGLFMQLHITAFLGCQSMVEFCCWFWFRKEHNVFWGSLDLGTHCI